MPRPSPVLRWLRLLTLALGSGLLATTACEESDPEPIPAPEPTVEVLDYGFLESETAAALDIVENELRIPNSAVLFAGCTTTRTRTTAGGVRTIRITFNNTVCGDGRARRGTLLLSWTPGPDSLTTARTFRTENYVVDSLRLRVRAVITPSDARTRSVASTDTLVYRSQASAVRAATRVWTWTTGNTTAGDFSDDRFTLQGTTQFTSREGVSTQVRITADNPLVWRRRCRTNRSEFVRGEVTLTPAGLPESRLDYGLDSCDGIARLYIGNRSGDIPIR